MPTQFGGVGLQANSQNACIAVTLGQSLYVMGTPFFAGGTPKTSGKYKGCCVLGAAMAACTVGLGGGDWAEMLSGVNELVVIRSETRMTTPMGKENDRIFVLGLEFPESTSMHAAGGENRLVLGFRVWTFGGLAIVSRIGI